MIAINRYNAGGGDRIAVSPYSYRHVVNIISVYRKIGESESVPVRVWLRMRLWFRV